MLFQILLILFNIIYLNGVRWRHMASCVRVRHIFYWCLTIDTKVILFLIIELHINSFFNQPEKCQMRKDTRYVCDRHAVYSREFSRSTNMSWIDSIAHLNFSVIFALHFYALVTQINQVECRKKSKHCLIHIISYATIVREMLVEKIRNNNFKEYTLNLFGTTSV